MCAQRRPNQPAHPCSRISLSRPHEKNFASLTIQSVPSEDSDQTERMLMLMLIFARSTCPNVCFLMLRLHHENTPI